ncbi:MAG: Holliday junction branch migration protein RuvA [Actinobacteria bacterium]|nr:Holliday junction branch migration protein RuvA [Actinomycetota bacterium]
MIAHLRGRVAARAATTVVVDVNGVGYLVHVPSADRIPPRGEPVELHTSLQVREDSMTLFGFPDRAALETFDLLLTSSGVGPKLALAALATHRPDVLRAAIATEDVATLTAVPGIGRKVAQRLVLELRDKVGGVDGELPGAATAAGGVHTPLAEVREALVSLGYGAGEVQTALAELEPDGEVADLLRRALRSLGASATAGSRR